MRRCALRLGHAGHEAVNAERRRAPAGAGPRAPRARVRAGGPRTAPRRNQGWYTQMRISSASSCVTQMTSEKTTCGTVWSTSEMSCA